MLRRPGSVKPGELHATVGELIRIPLAGELHEFRVLGIWRDYARASGAIAIRDVDYDRITGDASRTDAALWLAPGTRAADVIEALRAKLDAAGSEFRQPGEMRALSLAIFDRSFAVTYLLEIAAIVIGLIGVAATFSAQALARPREFGMLRHLGVTRPQILAQFALEGLLVTLLGIASGLLAGFAVALVLIHVVNPQSFHWTMSCECADHVVVDPHGGAAGHRDPDRGARRAPRRLGRSGAGRAGRLVKRRSFVGGAGACLALSRDRCAPALPRMHWPSRATMVLTPTRASSGGI